MTYKTLFLVPLIALAACGTPREQCINNANRPVAAIDRQIAVARGNIQRGYALAEVEDVRIVRTVCERDNPDGTVSRYPCSETERFTREVPVSISVAEERVKLAELQERRAAAVRNAQAAAQQCIATHPE
ncbi:hypothetical protein [Octadecabacter ascidiaceicola]|uniref:Lipoprotein n=1 Tax=Octadecabacter ascidiaceicola TaxID=1655543 RepID=A0A238KKV7_9RHOB|nr:hypothetical protein [Octadecabacter ascidiaceicola]SMX43383.1 hypothetical protein OCA8868_02944 [Octadecabacter ascidiaceicola]